jgi:AbrB family looped-hinge helix DNA binding protein
VERFALTDEAIIDVTKVSDKGQVVIPKEIRDKFNFTEGSRLVVVATSNAVVLQRIDSLVGSAKTKELLERVKWLAERLGLRPS